MSTQSNPLHEGYFESHLVAHAEISVTHPIYWSIRRELLEHRSLVLAPVAVGAVILLGFLVNLVHLPGNIRSAMAADPMQQHYLIEKPYNLAALMLMGTTLIVALFYCLDALHSERRDRSILFWKSLPVSDLMTVLSKASIPVVVLPLVAFVVTVATQFIMLEMSSVVLAINGVGAAALWRSLPLFRMWVMLLFHLVAIHGLWYAPFFGWLLLASSWARRAALLWAALPVLAIGLAEKLAFNTTHFLGTIGQRFIGGPETGSAGLGATTTPGGEMMQPLTFRAVSDFLVNPSLWVGMAIFAVLLAAAVQLRRDREPI